MKTTEEIKSIIEAYNELNNLVVEKTKFLEKIDPMYSTFRGIEDINFDSDTVYVTCDDTLGCYNSESFSFPLSYLLMDENDLKIVVQQDKEKRELDKKLKEEQKKKQKRRRKKGKRIK